MSDQPTKTKIVEDPSPSKFGVQALAVAVVLIALGVVVFFLASEVAGAIVALLGSVFAVGSQVARDNRLP